MDGSQSATIAALEDQLRRLKRVAEQVDSCRARLGRPGDGSSDGIWRGPAHNAWLYSVDVLRSQLTEASGRTHQAVASSQRALETMGNRG